MTEGKISVMLADDQTLIRDGLKAILKTDRDIVIVSEAANGREAMEKARTFKPDVVLMDIRMPEMDGVEATRQIKSELPGTRVIILTTFDDDDYIFKAMGFGASGYLLKDIDGNDLVLAIKSCIKGNVILPGKIAEKITSRLTGNTNGRQTITPDEFTEREMDIIKLMMEGKSNADIAGSLYLSNGTVKNYISQIYMKINVRDRTNAILYFKDHFKD
ncbi:MAG TPA: response regulator transcription factor [Clostridia bacterium]|nr:response regulator transcription factor [Clostridia bacterium]HPQ47302.1 response regulator transcription factor [Clostridia bacterium]HRX41457.1 response regulator transcription factor [Clostridia bacterium]